MKSAVNISALNKAMKDTAQKTNKTKNFSQGEQNEEPYEWGEL